MMWVVVALGVYRQWCDYECTIRKERLEHFHAQKKGGIYNCKLQLGYRCRLKRQQKEESKS